MQISLEVKMNIQGVPETEEHSRHFHQFRVKHGS